MYIFINENILAEDVSVVDLRNAIKQKKQIRFSYENTFGKRLVEPVLLGKTKRGNLAIRGYQINGPTDTENRTWKIFLTSKMDQLELTDNDSQLNWPKYNRAGDEEFISIILQIQ